MENIHYNVVSEGGIYFDLDIFHAVYLYFQKIFLFLLDTVCLFDPPIFLPIPYCRKYELPAMMKFPGKSNQSQSEPIPVSESESLS